MRPSTALLLLTTRCAALGTNWLPADEYNSLYPGDLQHSYGTEESFLVQK